MGEYNGIYRIVPPLKLLFSGKISRTPKLFRILSDLRSEVTLTLEGLVALNSLGPFENSTLYINLCNLC